MTDTAQMSIEDLLLRLRTILRHVGRRDRETVGIAMGAIQDLTVRLYRAEHPAAVVAKPPGRIVITHPDEPVAKVVPATLTPCGTTD